MTMRMRVIVETDVNEQPKGETHLMFRQSMRNLLECGQLAKAIPGTIVYVATEIVDSAVVSHDGKNVTVG